MWVGSINGQIELRCNLLLNSIPLDSNDCISSNNVGMWSTTPLLIIQSASLNIPEGIK